MIPIKPRNTRRNSLNQTNIDNILPNRKQRRISLNDVKQSYNSKLRRHSSVVHHSQLNQRETTFSHNSSIPELNIFTDGPGVGKYSSLEPINRIQPAFAVQKAERLIDQNIAEHRKTPDFYYKTVVEHIPGHYMSEDLYDTQPHQRRTSFSNNLLIPDLNIFTDGPGSGKYGRRSSMGDRELDSTLKKYPSFSIPRAEWSASRPLTADPKIPGHHYYPKKEKIPGYYPIGIANSGSNRSNTPGPSDFAPEKSKDYLQKSIAHSIPQAKRFTNFLF